MKELLNIRQYLNWVLFTFPLLITISGSKTLSAQEVLGDFWTARHLAILHDYGYGWLVNSSLKPYRWERLTAGLNNFELEDNSALSWLRYDLLQELKLNSTLASTGQDTLNFRWRNGFLLQLPMGGMKPFSGFSVTPYTNLTLQFRNHLSLQLYLRATNEPASIPHFSGQSRDIRRAGFNSSEFDHTALAYQNNWLTLQFGRGRQNWGPMVSNNLALSENGAAYDHFMAEFRYKRFTGRFFYGFLESVELDSTKNVNRYNVNRYIVGHGLEYSNKRNLVFGLSEVIIFSGVNRPMDLSYLNPLAVHLEVEQNRRANAGGDGGGNAVWSVFFDWMAWQGLRLSGNWTVDEFQFDKKDREIGRPDATAYQFRAAYSRAFGSVGATLSAEHERVGTFTFRHTVGTNNFAARDLFLGTEIGSDVDRLSLGLRLIFPQRFIFKSTIGWLREGEKNIQNSIYQSYEKEEFRKGPFPSGIVQRTRFFDWRLTYSPLRNIELIASGRFSNSSGRLEANQKYVIFSLNGYLPWRFGL